MTDWDWVALKTSLAVLMSLAALSFAIYLKSKQSRSKEKPVNSTPSWMWVFLIAVVGLITYSVSGSPKPGPGPASPTIPAWVVPVLLVLGIVGFVVATIARQFFQHYDRVASRALKRGQAGDTEGAIAELRAAMGIKNPAKAKESTSWNPYSAPAPRRKGSAARANAMGALHSLREEWSEAYQWFREAEAIGGRHVHYLGNQGVMLWKMGRTVDAVGPLEEACSLAPEDALQRCNLGLVLFDLGRINEAREQLERAEANYKKLVMFPAAAKAPLGAEIESLRGKIEAGTIVS